MYRDKFLDLTCRSSASVEKFLQNVFGSLSIHVIIFIFNRYILCRPHSVELLIGQLPLLPLDRWGTLKVGLASGILQHLVFVPQVVAFHTSVQKHGTL